MACDTGYLEEGEITIARPARASQCCVNLATPTYQGLPQVTLHAVIGQTVVLPCKPSGYPPPRVTWNLPITASRYHTSSAGLTIKGVVATDDHIYRCTVTNIFGHKVKVINLSVTEPLSVNVTTSATNHTEGVPGTITLTCRYRGIPDPSVKWLHIGPLGKTQSVTSGISTSVTTGPISKSYVSTLTLKDPNIFAAGTYICQVSNAAEQKHDNVSITIYAKPRVVTPPMTQTVMEGSNVTLRCKVVGYPPPAITWEFPQSQGHPPFNARLNPDQTVTLMAVDEFNEGEYKCVAKNRYGTDEGSGTITVIKPVRIQVTSQVNSLKGAPAIALDCHASGDPAPTVSWSKLDGTLNRSNPRYILLPNGDFILTSITPATMEGDSGVYKCTATNGVTTTYMLSVVYMDMGRLNCSTTFQECSTKKGVACG
ncbi:peroxidasin homolog [Gigantopelta aegis]|uniref:peroxidasin homolog n=1 Tax=Gigantopelta aegis TaxID=1735272 RepID=UPI001B88B93F|nr:peroxidasin homolog [Gigantopelta aegis]